MFNEVPVRIWLLIAITATAFTPARYIFRYLTQSVSAQDITQSARDFDEQASAKFARNLTLLVALVALAAFIYTPAAANFAQSPSFWPLLMAACGAWSLFTVVKGATGGTIEPLAKGFHNTYERVTQPKRFWASMTWNALFGVMCFWIGFQMSADAPTKALEDRCYDRKDTFKPQDEIVACSTLISDRTRYGGSLASIIAARGVAYHKLGDYRRAMTDYSRALDLDPHDSSSHYNRGLIYQQNGDDRNAVTEFDAAIREDANNADARNRLAEIQTAQAKADAGRVAQP